MQTGETEHMTKNTNHPTNVNRFQILALNGGGARALFSAHVLQCLEEDTGMAIRDTFDLIAGTSAGGIIALALGSGLSPGVIRDMYSDLIPRIFPNRWRMLRQLVRTAYDPAPLRVALASIFGDRILGDSDIPLVVPAWNVDTGQVYVFKTPHHERLARDWRDPMIDVAMATTASPTFFPAARLGNVRLIDGGVWANNPSVVAVAEAIGLLGVDRRRSGCSTSVRPMRSDVIHTGLIGVAWCNGPGWLPTHWSMRPPVAL